MKYFKLTVFVTFVTGMTLIFVTCRPPAGTDADVQSIEAINSGDVAQRHASHIICGAVNKEESSNLNTPEKLRDVIYRSMPTAFTSGSPALFPKEAYRFDDSSRCAEELKKSIESSQATPQQKQNWLVQLEKRKTGLKSCWIRVPDSKSAFGERPVILLSRDIDNVKQNMLAQTFYAFWEYYVDYLFSSVVDNPQMFKNLSEQQKKELEGYSKVLQSLKNLRRSVAENSVKVLKEKGSEGSAALSRLVQFYGVSTPDDLVSNINAQNFFAAEAGDSIYCGEETHKLTQKLGYQSVIDSYLKESWLGVPYFYYKK